MPITLSNRATWPERGSVWRHRNGNIYKVMLYTNIQLERQDEYPTTIVYENIHNGELYSRKLMDWERSMIPWKPVPDAGH